MIHLKMMANFSAMHGVPQCNGSSHHDNLSQLGGSSPTMVHFKMKVHLEIMVCPDGLFHFIMMIGLKIMTRHNIMVYPRNDGSSHYDSILSRMV